MAALHALQRKARGHHPGRAGACSTAPAIAIEQLPAFAVKAVDTTAAGDIFHGAFAYGVLQGLSDQETLRLAAATAALVRDGARRPHVDSRPGPGRGAVAPWSMRRSFAGGRLCVVGNICRDVKIAPIAPDERLFPRRRNADASSSSKPSAAAGPIVRWSAAGLGAEVRFAGKVGDDALGTRLEAALLARGVRSFVRRDPADANRQFGGAELLERLPAFHQLPAEQRHVLFRGHRSGGLGRRRAPASGRRLVFRADAWAGAMPSSCRPPATGGWHVARSELGPALGIRLRGS